jgi:hypothetical protein
VVTFPYGQQITLITRTRSGQDTYGNDIYTESSTVVTGAFNPGTSVELVQGQDLLTVQPTIYLPPDVQPQAIDAVEVDGLRFDVDGDTNVWQSPFTGWQPGNVVKLKRVTG